MNKLLLVLAFIACLDRTSGYAQNSRRMLEGHVPSALRGLRSSADLDSSRQLHLDVCLPPRNGVELSNLLKQLSDPASPNFRHYLTPQEFTARFGPTQEDYQNVLGYLRTNGFQVTEVHSNRLVVGAVAKAADIQKAFGVRLKVFRHPTEARDFFATDVEPSVETNLPISSVGGLTDFVRPHPVGLVAKALGAGKSVPLSGSAISGLYAAGDFRAAYAPGVTLNGAGQYVGLVEFGGYFSSDVVAYENQFGLPQVTISNVLLNGFTSVTNNPSAEEPLDIEVAVSMAPGIKGIYYYYGSTTDTILSQIASDNQAKQVSASWEYPTDGGTDTLLQQMAAEGISYFQASGDSRAFSNNMPACIGSAYVTDVGGTSLSTAGPLGSYTGETVWGAGTNGTGGGKSPSVAIPSWQSGLSMTTNHGSTVFRNVPDIALTADNVYIIFGGNAYNASGTSCAAPLWAAYMAMINQQAALYGNPPTGFLNPAVYAIGTNTNYTNVFHDIVTGNNFDAGSPTNYPAVAGYDLCTGWGTPVGQATIDAIAPPNGLRIQPTPGFTVYAPAGGPFSATNQNIVLSNSGPVSLSWAVGNPSSLIDISVASGTLATNGAVTVSLSLDTSNANLSTPGAYPVTIVISNITGGFTFPYVFNINVEGTKVWNSSVTNLAPVDGPGTWANQSPANNNWYDGANNDPWTNALPTIAVIGTGSGAAGTITLGSAITASELIFNPPGSSAYTVTGAGNILTVAAGVITANASATENAALSLLQATTLSVTNGSTLSLGGPISGTVALNKTGGGTVLLKGTNTFSGGTTISAGAVQIGSAGALGNSNVLMAGGTLDLNGTSLTVSNLSGTGIITDTSSVSGTTTMGFYESSSAVFSGNIQNGGTRTVAITKKGSGVLTLSGTNSFTGALNLDENSSSINDGAVKITSSSALQGAGQINILNTSSGTSSLQLDGAGGAITVPRNFVINGRNNFSTPCIESLAGSNSITGNISLTPTGSGFAIQDDAGLLTLAGNLSASSGTPTLTIQGAGNVAITGNITNGSGSVTPAILMNLTGALTLSGSNTYTGATTIAAGTVNVNSTRAFGGSTGTVKFTGVCQIDNTSAGAITLVNNNPQSWQADFTFLGSNPLTFGTGAVTMTGSRHVTVASSVLTEKGAISGSGLGLTKQGNGTLALAGTCTYSGATAVSAGTLQVDGSLASGSVLTVQSNGTLSGVGTINGATTVQSGGTLGPGDSGIGGIKFASSLTLAGQTVLEISKSGSLITNDLITVTGALSMGGNLIVTNIGATAFADGDSFHVLSAGSYSGSFASMTLPSLTAGLLWDTTKLKVNGTISVASPPGLIIPLVTVNAQCGSNPSLGATPSGTAPLSLQWYDINSNTIAGATNSSLTLSNAHQAVAGNYTLRVTNDVGSTSAVVTLGVVDTLPPNIVQVVTNQALALGSNCLAVLPDYRGMLVATDNCSGTVHVSQSPLPGTALGAGSNTVVFLVDDGNGNTNSSSTTVTVSDQTPPVVTGQPQNVIALAGTSASFSAAGSSCSAIACQWYLGTNAISGMTNFALSIPAVSTNNAGLYHVAFMTVGGTTTSANANLTVIEQLPVFLGGQMLPDGSFQLSYTGPAGLGYHLLDNSNVDLTSGAWSVLTNDVFGTNTSIFTDYSATNGSARFYRIVIP